VEYGFMDSDEIRKKNRVKRGQISSEDILPFVDYSIESLIEMITSDNPQERTISAVLLGDMGDKTAIEPLCDALKNEKSLYSRIAMSEALSKMGELAVPSLIKLLGEIGKNQETDLPTKYFKKKSFPLVRDMAARTLVNIGNPATPYLITFMGNDNEFKVQQAIDALGGIAAKTGDKRALPVLIKYFFTGSNEKITFWKIVRSLGGFKNDEKAIKPLTLVLNGDYDPPIIWEALRSLGKIQITTPGTLNMVESFTHDEHPEIKMAAEDALNILKQG
jgi:HEAT repeat protein